MAALPVAVLDVVVDEAEVVAELDGRRAGQGPAVLARDRVIGEEAEQRPDPLAARGPGPVQREVVADHLVQAVGRWVAIGDEADDLGLGVGDEGREVDVGRDRGHRAGVYTKRVPRR